MGSTAYTNIVLVTGANTGLGWQISKTLAKEHSDYHIIMSGRNKDAIEKAVSDLRASEGGLTNIEPLVLDVTSDESIAAAAASVSSRHGRLDVLINNAGLTSSNGFYETDYSRPKWEMVFQVNVFGSGLVTDAFLPLLAKSRAEAKRVIFMTSTLGSIGALTDKSKSKSYREGSKFRIYSTSKAALNMLMMQYAVEYEADPSWKINVCCPGHCATNLNAGKGVESPETGAINAVRLATAGKEGESGTFTNRHGTLPW